MLPWDENVTTTGCPQSNVVNMETGPHECGDCFGSRRAPEVPFSDVDFCRELLTSYWEDQWRNERAYLDVVADEAKYLMSSFTSSVWKSLSENEQRRILNRCNAFADMLDEDFLKAVVSDYLENVLQETTDDHEIVVRHGCASFTALHELD